MSDAAGGAGMSERDAGQSRWRWREVSPRRVVGQFLLALGLAGVGMVFWHLVDGKWSSDFDLATLIVSALMLAVGSALLWRQKSAPWP